jgi:hypothetical protein
MKMIDLVGVSLMISYCLVTSARRSDFRIGKMRLAGAEPMTIEELSFLSARCLADVKTNFKSFKATDRTSSLNTKWNLHFLEGYFSDDWGRL